MDRTSTSGVKKFLRPAPWASNTGSVTSSFLLAGVSEFQKTDAPTSVFLFRSVSPETRLRIHGSAPPRELQRNPGARARPRQGSRTTCPRLPRQGPTKTFVPGFLCVRSHAPPRANGRNLDNQPVPRQGSRLKKCRFPRQGNAIRMSPGFRNGYGSGSVGTGKLMVKACNYWPLHLSHDASTVH